MVKAKQLSVWVESAPSQIARIAGALAEAKINITAFSCHSVEGDSPLRIQVSHHAKARKILQALGCRITEEDVLRITVKDKFGALAEIGARLGAAGINVQYGYGAIGAKQSQAELVFAVSDLDGALEALRSLK